MGVAPQRRGTAVSALALVFVLASCATDRGGPLPNVLHVSIPINRAPDEVYAFASDPRNLPRWATGLARSDVRRDGDSWVVDSPMGSVRVRFAERNDLGVLDHDVTLESGETIHNPLRVLPRGDGSEVVFTLFRRQGVTDEALAGDRAAVEEDLKTLKRLLEGGTATQGVPGQRD
jgi:hypothetical protein